MTTTIEILNPTFARVSGQELRKAPFPRLEEGTKVRIGFLNNQKPNTQELLALVESGLREHYQVESRTFFKGDAAHPAPPEVIEELSRFADVAVLATAD
ncbi:MAG TPA: hypothetical protein VFD49_16620 [Candidatus Dormibacteraeota bacterium]|nr:hypothetical protein [Candidatus Dormibacteraeota bacterium]